MRSDFTSLEFDDTVRPKGVVYAALARLFDHAVGLGQLRLTDPNSLGYLYDRQSVALAAVYTLDQTNKTLNLGGRLSPSQFKVYDMLGNPLTVAPTSIPLGRRPIYIEGQGITPAALRTALEGGAMSNQADSQPPNLTLSDIQVTGASDASLRVRWLALDDTALPSDSQPDALLYSYHLVGLAGQDTWTPWTPSTYVDYTSVPAGSYVFEVKAKDAAGNVSPVASEVLRVGAVCVVDITAITPVAARWAGRQGQSGYDAQYDFDHNGVIDILDVMQVAARWGRPC